MFTPRSALSIVAAKAGACAGKNDPSAWITKLLCALLPAVALVMTGCGSSTTQPPTLVSGAPIVLTAASTFEPHPFALSPDDSNGIVNPAKTGSAAVKQAKPADGGTTGSTVPFNDHWFYLVNGGNIPTANTTPFIPNVLTVSGPAPNGAPNPNGWDTVSGEPMNPPAAGSQLWKAIAAPDSSTAAPIFYLRSATSFTTASVAYYPSLLVGFGATGAHLDLGYPSQFYYPFTPAVYMNQQASPTGDQSSFQQWSYNDNAQLTNLFVTPQILYEQAPAIAVGNGPVAPENQWYPYPNYYLEQVIKQQSSAPPFPTTDTPGEVAAYGYLSQQFLPGLYTAAKPEPTCIYEGTDYAGIRCEYYLVSATATLETCASNSLGWSQNVPRSAHSYNGTRISTTEFQTVASQIAMECQYAADVQTTFNNYATIMNYVFTESSVAINQLSTDVALSSATGQSQSLSAVPAQVISGMAYTLLSASKDPAAGVLANLMMTGVNSAVAANPNSSLKAPLATTVGTLYSDLEGQFAILTQQESNGENAILEDWGRLSVVGPLTEKTGYNGLGLTTTEMDTIETQALKGYSLAVMQQLMPAGGNVLRSFVATSEPNSMTSIPSDDVYSYESFGALPPGPGNWIYVFEPDGTDVNGTTSTGSYPDSQVMQTDIQGNGANMFEFFNALNGWAGMSQSALGTQNLGCSSQVTTLFNATPTDLSVIATPNKGNLATPGYDFNPGELTPGLTSAATYELRPYGYLPLYTSAGTSEQDNNVGMSLAVAIYDEGFSSQSAVAEFTLAASTVNEGACKLGGSGDSGVLGPLGVSHISVQDGYSFSPSAFSLKQATANLPGGMWVTVFNTNN